MSSDDENSSSEDEVPVESLIQGREKRSTAGRQMSALLDAEADDELALLFEEVDDDNEFAADVAEDGGEEEDMGLESSSDDEDQGPNAQADDFEGEQQIQKEEKEEKKKKRAREDLRYRITSKKVKVDPTAAPKPPTTPAPRPRKKSERVSWIPTPDEGPTRSSSRRQTMQNKELTHARLKDSEEKRVRLIATMEEAAKRKAKHKPKELTQAERLAEAERVERHNSKSLNRWEEMEKRKAEERKAKIEALQNRRLEGPVISYWSGVATWADGRLTQVGKVKITPKPEKDDAARKKSKKGDKEGKTETEQKPNNEPLSQPASAPPAENSALPTEPNQDQQSTQPPQPTTDATNAVGTTQGPPEVQAEASAASTELVIPSNIAAGAQVPASAPSPLSKSETAPSGAAEPSKPNEQPPDERGASQTADPTTNQESPSHPGESLVAKDIEMPDAEIPKPETKSNEVQRPDAEPSPVTQVPSEPASVLPISNALGAIPGSAAGPVQADSAEGQPQGTAQVTTQTEQQPIVHMDEQDDTTTEQQPPAPPAVIEQTGRCLTVLENFDDKTAHNRDFNIYFNAKKPPRLTKISSSLCVITSLPSRYRDPDTSLPFANSHAYREIRHTAKQKYSWSSMLGCYVGPTGIAARGVPDRFLDPNAKESSKPSGGDESTAAGSEGATKASKDASTMPEPTPTAAATPAPAPAPSAPAPAAVPTTVAAGDAMDVDK
ncbi:YL1 nuclear protein-domain-containing protein [Aspergillus unguis]